MLTWIWHEQQQRRQTLEERRRTTGAERWTLTSVVRQRQYVVARRRTAAGRCSWPPWDIVDVVLTRRRRNASELAPVNWTTLSTDCDAPCRPPLTTSDVGCPRSQLCDWPSTTSAHWRRYWNTDASCHRALSAHCPDGSATVSRVATRGGGALEGQPPPLLLRPVPPSSVQLLRPSSLRYDVVDANVASI